MYSKISEPGDNFRWFDANCRSCRVQDSLSYFVDMYTSLAQWQAVVDRLIGFGMHMTEVEDEKPQRNLKRLKSIDNKVSVRNLDLSSRMVLN